MLRKLFVAGLVCGLALWAHPTPAAEKPTFAFPTDASVVIRVKSPKATIDKVADAADKLYPGMGSQVQAFSGAIGSVISNPTMDGVDMENDWWAAVFLSTDAAPRVIYAIPAKNLDDMQAAVGKDTPFIKYEKWGIYGADADTIGKIKDRIGGKGNSIETMVNDPTVAVLQKGDISAFVNLIEVKNVYGAFLPMGKMVLQNALDQAAQASGDNAGGQALTKGGAQFLNALFQGIDDAQGLAVTLAIADDAIHFEQFATVKEESPSAQFLSANPGSELKSLSSLPRSGLGYFGLSFDMSSLTNWAMQLTKTPGTDAETSQGLDKLQKELAKLKIGPIVGSFDISDKKEEGSSLLLVTDVSDPKKYAEAMRAGLQLADKIKTPGVTRSTKVSPAAEKFGSNSGDLIVVTQKFDEDNSNLEFLAKLQQLFFGDKEIVTRSVALKDRVVQLTGGSSSQMAGILKGIEGKPATSDSVVKFEKMRKQLGNKPNLVALADLPNLAKKIAQLIKEKPDAVDLPFDATAIAEMDFAPSYLGFSVAVESTSAHVRTIIPLEQVQGIVKIVTTVMMGQ